MPRGNPNKRCMGEFKQRAINNAAHKKRGRHQTKNEPIVVMDADTLDIAAIFFTSAKTSITVAPTANDMNIIVVAGSPYTSISLTSRQSCIFTNIIAKGKAKKYC